LPPGLETKFGKQIDKDFPTTAKSKGSGNPRLSAEAASYRLITLPVPKEIVLEVGGLAFRSDGKLLACTRRGEVWLISNPDSEDPAQIKYQLFASGLHEALGLHVDGKDIFVVQRPELTRLTDRDGDDVV